MLLTIQRYTNRKVNDLRHAARVVRSFMSPFTLDEIKAAIGILLSTGADRDNFCSVRDLWDPAEGRPFYRGSCVYQQVQILYSCYSLRQLSRSCS